MPSARTFARFICLIVAVCALGIPRVASAATPYWLDVDLEKLTLTVYGKDLHVVREFHNIAIGSGGISELHMAGDMTTPRGVYRITRINPKGRFGLFLEVNYPTDEHARLAYYREKISQREMRAIAHANRLGVSPPRNTALGGFIGIHGIGTGSLEVHRRVNWTDGCIALTNEEMDALKTYVTLGTQVVFR